MKRNSVIQKQTKHWLRASSVFAPREKALQKVKSSFLWWPTLRSHALSLSFILLLKAVIRIGPAWMREKIDSTFQWRNVSVTLRNAWGVGYMLVQSVLENTVCHLRTPTLLHLSPHLPLWLLTLYSEQPHSQSCMMTLLRRSTRPLFDSNYSTL